MAGTALAEVVFCSRAVAPHLDPKLFEDLREAATDDDHLRSGDGVDKGAADAPERGEDARCVDDDELVDSLWVVPGCQLVEGLHPRVELLIDDVPLITEINRGLARWTW